MSLDPSGAQRTYYETVSMCPTCSELVPGRVVGRPDGVFVARECPAHGPFEGLVCSDTAWFEGLGRFDVEPVRPGHPRATAAAGCPRDCGLCPEHRQIAGTAAIEISNRCDADCPVCLADNRGTFELPVDEVRAMVDSLLAAQGFVDALTLSGGEPTMHPDILEILAALDRPEIGRVVLDTNGLRIAEDDRFLDALARRRVMVSLHYDGSGARRLRGVSAEVQERALARLLRWGIPTAPLVLAVRDVNDGELGTIVASLLTRSPAIQSVVVSLMAYTGANGSRFPGDPRRRLTIPAALELLDGGSAGNLGRRAFIPLPMPNPVCAAIGYFLVMDRELTPLIPLADVDDVVHYLRNMNFARDDGGLERLLRDGVDRVYAHPEAYPDSERLLRKFRDLLCTLFPQGRPLEADRRRAVVEERVKVVYLIQFMDPWTFDSVRLSKCSCQHLMPDGRIVPSCAYYSYHRRLDPRFAPAAAPARGEGA
ncbi:MAG: radical SAM protein [Acidobacteria bacterium]|nr:radical SAM protein [Acidobacteriota bacterium]